MLDTDTMHKLTQIARDEAGDEARIRHLTVEGMVKSDDDQLEVWDCVRVHVRMRSDNDLWAWFKWNASRRIRREGDAPGDLAQIVREATREAIKSTRRQCSSGRSTRTRHDCAT